ncbi:translation initiation factor IF-2-like [Portunus trituberculatus]|uniref:translation initiation factor IF-2-like n=1 Tax=Portunus trituberculatus TaxID=210409 RepID=UPI001E1CBD9A|nr:translation initiation factor IF-2-like [Portunus trituberculatus]
MEWPRAGHLLTCFTEGGRGTGARGRACAVRAARLPRGGCQGARAAVPTKPQCVPQCRAAAAAAAAVAAARALQKGSPGEASGASTSRPAGQDGAAASPLPTQSGRKGGKGGKGVRKDRGRRAGRVKGKGGTRRDTQEEADPSRPQHRGPPDKGDAGPKDVAPTPETPPTDPPPPHADIPAPRPRPAPPRPPSQMSSSPARPLTPQQDPEGVPAAARGGWARGTGGGAVPPGGATVAVDRGARRCGPDRRGAPQDPAGAAP